MWVILSEGGEGVGSASRLRMARGVKISCVGVESLRLVVRMQGFFGVSEQGAREGEDSSVLHTAFSAQLKACYFDYHCLRSGENAAL